MASREGHAEVAVLLINNGAQVDVPNKVQMFELHSLSLQRVTNLVPLAFLSARTCLQLCVYHTVTLYYFLITEDHQPEHILVSVQPYDQKVNKWHQ